MCVCACVHRLRQRSDLKRRGVVVVAGDVAVAVRCCCCRGRWRRPRGIGPIWQPRAPESITLLRCLARQWIGLGPAGTLEVRPDRTANVTGNTPTDKIHVGQHHTDPHGRQAHKNVQRRAIRLQATGTFHRAPLLHVRELRVGVLPHLSKQRLVRRHLAEVKVFNLHAANAVSRPANW